MKTRWTKTPGRAGRPAGWALLVTMSVAMTGMISLAGVMKWAAQNSELASRNNEYFATTYAAEAATEKALAALSMDFQNYNIAMVSQHLDTYKTMVPTNSDDPTGNNYWSNYTFSGGTTAGRLIITNTASQTILSLPPPYTGLRMVANTYEIIANAVNNSAASDQIEATVGQAINIGTIPLFQFAVFYQNDMEVNPGAAMTITGPVHGNSQIYAGVGGGRLTLSNTPTAVLNFQTNKSPLDPSFRGSASVVFDASPPFASAQNPINLPVGTNMSGSGINSPANVYAILQVPNSSQGPGTSVGTNMLYNQADLIVLVSNNSMTVQTGPIASPLAINSNSYNLFLSTNTFTDQRQGMPVDAVVLNVSNMNNWIATNTALSSALGHTLQSVYIADERGTSNLVVTNVPVLPSVFTTYYPTAGSYVAPPFTNSQSYTVSTNPSSGTYIGTKTHNANGSYTANFITGYTYTNLVTQTNYVQFAQPAVYLTNGAVLPSGGLSVVSPDPAYVVGNWNIKPSNTGTSDAGQNVTTDTLPSGIYADAVTILSPAWNPANSALALSHRVATPDTVNAAILTGNVPSNGSYYSGGVENFVRFLEDWNNQAFTYNGSLVCMFPSQIATGHWPGTGTVYNAPNRYWAFDLNFNDPNKMPPLMPQTRALVRGKWASLPPGSTSF